MTWIPQRSITRRSNRALDTADLLVSLFQGLFDVCDAKTSFNILSTLARVCKKFEEPALALIWRDLPGFLPLLRLMPADMLRESTRSPGEWKFARPPVPKDWRRFLRYSKHIRSICYTEGSPGAPHPSVFRDLGFYRPKQDLLPCLTKLEWHSSTMEGAMGSTIFLHPHLEVFELETSKRMCRQALFSIAAARTPNLRILRLGAHAEDSERAAIVDYIRRMPFLEEVSIKIPGFGTMTTLRTLAVLKHLARLEIVLARFPPLPVGDSRGRAYSKGKGKAVAFPSLRHLHVRGDHNSISTMLQLRSHPLETLSMVVQDSPAQADFRECLSKMQEHDANHLRSLSITKWEGKTDTTINELLPLVGLPLLRELDISCAGLKLEDTDVLVLASSWPLLEKLALSPWCEEGTTPSISLGTLINVIRTCPMLSHLQVMLRAVGTVDSFVESSGSISPLRHLSLGHSSVEKPFFVAALFASLFPQLEVLEWGRGNNSNHRVWGEVWQKYQALRSARAKARCYSF